MVLSAAKAQPSLARLIEESHKDLQQWFLMQQECLLLAEDNLAQQAFICFEQFMRAHLDFENRYLYCQQGLAAEVDLQWSLGVYLKDHTKIEQQLVQQKCLLQSYCQLQGRKKRIALLELLAKQQRFTQLLEHHDLREESDVLKKIANDQHVAVLWCEQQKCLNMEHQSFKARLKKHLETTL